jgi:hypothetical protein
VGCCCADRLGAAATLLFEADFEVRLWLPDPDAETDEDADDGSAAPSLPDLRAALDEVEAAFTVLARLVFVWAAECAVV